MRRITLFLIAIIFFTPFSGLEAQKTGGKYDLLFASGTITPEANISVLPEARINPAEIINGKYYRIIQFLQIPSNEEKEELKSKGVELLSYIPRNAWYAAIQNGTDLKTANARGNIRSVLPVLADYKIHPELKNGNLPAYAEVVSGKADIIITYFKGVSSAAVQAELNAKINGIEILEDEAFAQTLKVRMDKASVQLTASIPSVFFIEPATQWEVENNSGTTLHRSNTINSKLATGLHYDGTGVGVSVGDGSYFYDHIDFKGRTTSAVTTASGTTNDHPTHVTGTVGSAGNINPRYAGQAPGANLISRSGYADISSVSAIQTLHNSNGVRVTQHSLGQTCNGGYDANARLTDLEVESLPNLVSVHSAGNSGGTNCNYGAGTSFGQITGGYKQGKNCITTGNLTYADAIASSSSRGPAKDGRIKPDLCAKGSSVQSTMPNNLYGGMSGTSMASPGISGCVAQLYHSFRDLNGGQDPKLALLKGIMLNTAQDLGNVGPDFTYGWGRVNVWSAYNTIKDQRYFSGSVADAQTKTHTITVPANVKEMKVMVYWADPAATAGVSQALVNDLDITLSNGANTYLPWELTTMTTATELAKPAIKGTDNTNNMEQVSVTNPAAGTYTLNVNGLAIPTGPQEYWVTYDFITDYIKVTYPMGGDYFVPAESEYIRWDANGTTGNFTIEYSADGGTTWTVLSSAVAGTARYYAWTVPSVTTGKARIRVSRSGLTSTSDADFNIIRVPTNLTISYRCSTSFQLSWTAATGATSYEVYLLGAKYMMPQGTTAATNFVVTNAPNTSITWASVRALADNGTTLGRRAIAIQVPTAINACPPTSAKNYSELSPYSLSVFPNPMNENATLAITLSEEENLSIAVYDICGKEISSVFSGGTLPAGEHSFTLGGLASSGIYMVMVKGEKGMAMEKIVVTK